MEQTKQEFEAYRDKVLERLVYRGLDYDLPSLNEFTIRAGFKYGIGADDCACQIIDDLAANGGSQ